MKRSYRSMQSGLILSAGLALAFCGCSGEETSQEPEVPVGLDKRPANPSCTAPPRDQLPQKLTETGCFGPGDPTEAKPALIPYTLLMPLWADDAGKDRRFAIPEDEVIRVSGTDLTFPVGSVMAKTFFRDGSRIETRLLVRHDDGEWAGYAYAWNDDETEATLLEDARELADWRIPSREDCKRCHTEAAGFTLGPELGQWNHEQIYPRTGRQANQLITLAELGMLDGLPSDKPEQLPRFVFHLDESGDHASWSRDYLHVNCSQCHRPGGPEDADGDLRRTTPLGETGVCDREPEHGDLGVDDARFLAPGAPERSLLTLTMRDVGENRMPPLATRVIDDFAVDRLEQWISGLSGCGSE